MRIKVIEFQQEQLMNLFDMVPDKVLIYSKTSEASAPKSLYSNRQMNNFFGCNVVKTDATSRKRLNKKKKSLNSKIPTAPSKRAIFQDHGTQDAMLLTDGSDRSR